MDFGSVVQQVPWITGFIVVAWFVWKKAWRNIIRQEEVAESPVIGWVMVGITIALATAMSIVLFIYQGNLILMFAAGALSLVLSLVLHRFALPAFANAACSTTVLLLVDMMTVFLWQGMAAAFCAVLMQWAEGSSAWSGLFATVPLTVALVVFLHSLYNNKDDGTVATKKFNWLVRSIGVVAVIGSLILPGYAFMNGEAAEKDAEVARNLPVATLEPAVVDNPVQATQPTPVPTPILTPAPTPVTGISPERVANISMFYDDVYCKMSPEAQQAFRQNVDSAYGSGRLLYGFDRLFNPEKVSELSDLRKAPENMQGNWPVMRVGFDKSEDLNRYYPYDEYVIRIDTGMLINGKAEPFRGVPNLYGVYPHADYEYSRDGVWTVIDFPGFHEWENGHTYITTCGAIIRFVPK